MVIHYQLRNQRDFGSEIVSKDWGRAGAPAELQSKAAPFKLGASALVSTWDELGGALSSGYPVTICAKERFSVHRDQDGFSRARGICWHCVLIAGVRFDRPGACIMQSWGPDMADGPCALDQPTFSFWAGQHVIERILAEGDSWALSSASGFVQRPLPDHWNYHQAA